MSVYDAGVMTKQVMGLGLIVIAGCGGSGSDDDATVGATDSISTTVAATDDPDPEETGESDDTDATDDTEDPQETGSDEESSSSGGGGPIAEGLPCGTEFSYDGRTGCETVVDGIEVKFFPPPAGERVERLAIYFHGDGAADYMDGWAFSPEIFGWTDPRNTMVVGVLSPAFYEDGTVAFGAAQPEHAAMVATAIETMLAAWEIEHADQTMYWATSGGSWFFASSFIAHVGNRVPGVFVANCGGSGQSFGWSWDPMTDTATKDLIPIYFNYGTEDFLAPNIEGSITEYEGLGFDVDSLVHQGAMHCDHPIDGPTVEFWSRYVP